MGKKIDRTPLTIGVIEELKRKGYNQSEVAAMHGVSRQAVSWHKVEYGGSVTTRQVAHQNWPWPGTTNENSKSVIYQRLRDHGSATTSG